MARAPSLGGLPKSGFAAHAPPSTSPLLRKPSVYRTAVDPQGSRDNLGAFASLHATHRADTHRFQRRVIQFASIVLSHPSFESHATPLVNGQVQLHMERLIDCRVDLLLSFDGAFGLDLR